MNFLHKAAVLSFHLGNLKCAVQGNAKKYFDGTPARSRLLLLSCVVSIALHIPVLWYFYYYLNSQSVIKSDADKISIFVAITHESTTSRTMEASAETANENLQEQAGSSRKLMRNRGVKEESANGRHKVITENLIVNEDAAVVSAALYSLMYGSTANNQLDPVAAQALERSDESSLFDVRHEQRRIEARARAPSKHKQALSQYKNTAGQNIAVVGGKCMRLINIGAGESVWSLPKTCSFTDTESKRILRRLRSGLDEK